MGGTYPARSRRTPLQLWLHFRQPAPRGYDVAAVTDISVEGGGSLTPHILLVEPLDAPAFPWLTPFYYSLLFSLPFACENL